jgi:Bacterial Ig-like domain (group 3)
VTIEMGMRRLARIGMVVTLAAGSLAATAQTATRTTMTSEMREINGKTATISTISVLDADGAPVSGAVTLVEHGKGLSGAALDTEGKTEINLDELTPGDHTLTAVYSGDAEHAASASEPLAVRADAATPPDFTLALNPTTLSVKVGTAGNIQATVTPVNGFTGFLSLSCSGQPVSSGAAGGASLPVGVSCIFTPANLQVTNANSVSANMTLQTAGPQQTADRRQLDHTTTGTRVALAVLFPGLIGIGLLRRKRKMLGQTVILVAMAAISLLGTTACAARYHYLNHGPTFTGTPTGTYTITVTAQTSNGVAAMSHSQTFALTVN